jgi:DNA recombination-dependent growth factor C
MDDEKDVRIAQLERDVQEWKRAYEESSKRAIQLGAQNKMIVEAAANRLNQADQTIASLRKTIDELVGKILTIISRQVSLPTMKVIQDEINKLMGVKIA